MNSFSLYEAERYVSTKGVQVTIVYLSLHYNGSGFVQGVVYETSKGEIRAMSEKDFCKEFVPVGADF